MNSILIKIGLGLAFQAVAALAVYYLQGQYRQRVQRNPPADYHYVTAENSFNDVCSICLNDFNTYRDRVITPCRHSLHRRCAMILFKENSICPYCRAKISISFLEREGLVSL